MALAMRAGPGRRTRVPHSLIHMSLSNIEPVNLATLLWRAADAAPADAAILEASRMTSYEGLRDRASAIARDLTERGVRPGERVGVLAERGAEAAAAYFGALAAGAVVIVINERLRPRQVEYVLTRSGARVLLTKSHSRSDSPRRRLSGCCG